MPNFTNTESGNQRINHITNQVIARKRSNETKVQNACLILRECPVSLTSVIITATAVPTVAIVKIINEITALLMYSLLVAFKIGNKL